MVTVGPCYSWCCCAGSGSVVGWLVDWMLGSSSRKKMIVACAVVETAVEQLVGAGAS